MTTEGNWAGKRFLPGVERPQLVWRYLRIRSGAQPTTSPRPCGRVSRKDAASLQRRFLPQPPLPHCSPARSGMTRSVDARQAPRPLEPPGGTACVVFTDGLAGRALDAVRHEAGARLSQLLGALLSRACSRRAAGWCACWNLYMARRTLNLYQSRIPMPRWSSRSCAPLWWIIRHRRGRVAYPTASSQTSHPVLRRAQIAAMSFIFSLIAGPKILTDSRWACFQYAKDLDIAFASVARQEWKCSR